MIEAYLDESGIHDQAEMCVIAGYVGGKGQMKKLEKSWRRVLADFGFPMANFHAKDLVKSGKHFPMLKALARITGDHPKIWPVSFGLVVAHFNTLSLLHRRFLNGATLDRKSKRLLSFGCPSKPYFVPFQNIVKLVTNYAPVGGKANFNFGIDRTFADYARALFAQIQGQSREAPRPWSTWKSRERLGVIQFPRASQTAPLQAADLLVHLTYLHMLDCTAKGEFIAPTELLKDCLRNIRSREDHQYQDKESLGHVLGQVRKFVPGWDLDI